MDTQDSTSERQRPTKPPHVRPWIWALLAAVLTLATYLPSLAGEFVWDDVVLIENSPATMGGRPLRQFFLEPFWEADSLTPHRNLYYRPLVNLSYALDYRIHGLNSAGYRITNFAFHLTNVVLLFCLLRRMGTTGFVAALFSATWALLPRLAENVAWISGRTDVFAATGVFAALLAWGERTRRLWLCAVFLSLGLLCKETACAGLVALLVLELSGRPRRVNDKLQRIFLLIGPAVGWLLLKVRVSGLLPTGAVPQPAKIRILTSLEAIGRYTLMVFDWLRPRAEIGVIGQPSVAFAAVGAFMCLATLWGVAWTWRHAAPWPKAALVGALAALLPVLHFVQLTIDVNAADRFLYLPVALLLLFIGSVPKARDLRITQVLMGLVLLTSVPITVARAKSWTKPLDLWEREYQSTGGQCRTCRVELGKILVDSGDFGASLRMYQDLFRSTLSKGTVPALIPLNMGMLFNRLGDNERAFRLLRDLVKSQPEVPKYWRELAAVQTARFDFDAAETSAQRALQLMPTYADAQSSLKLIQSVRSKISKLNDPAIPAAERARILGACGRTREAESAWLEALSSNPSEEDLERGLRFVADIGSARAVATVLDKYAGQLEQFQVVTNRLRDKRQLHLKLVKLGLTH